MKYYDLWLDNHNAMRIQYIQNDVVRIRYNASGVFKPSLTERYGLVFTEFGDGQFRVEESDSGIRVFSGDMTVEISQQDGSFTVKNEEGTVIKKAGPIAPQEDRGVGCVFEIEDDERFYGGGYRAHQTIENRGMVLKNWRNRRLNYGPSPFMMSSSGWGVFWNITFRNYFDLGSRQKDQMVLWSEDGEVDIFLFSGDFRHIIDRYTDVTGKPYIMPLFGYGLTNVCSECVNQYIVMDIAERFRAEGIPCDTLDLEPDWMAVRYDKSVNKYWNKEKYHIDDWMTPDRTFIYALKEKGFKLSLWTPCDYDLTYEAERQYAKEHPEDKNEPLYETQERLEFKEAKGALLETFIAEKNGYIIDETSPFVTQSVVSDKYTVPEEPWFEHFKKFLDLGVRGIDEDGSSYSIVHPDKMYANGKGYQEMHNLNQSLIAKQYHDGYREYCGKRPMIQVPTTYIGSQKWTSGWAGDVPGRDIALLGMLKYSFQGYMNFTCDMDNKNIDGIHFGFLMGWAHFRNWGDMSEPWYLRKELKDAFTFYAKLRYSLMPYIYTNAYYGYKTGLAMCRAMVIMYPDDPRTYNMINEYMLGDWLLVGALAEEIYLPEGRWIDYWTGKEYEGRQDIKSGYPADRGGYLFIKKGAIIPYWPEVNYVGEKVIDTMTLRFYPYGQSSFTLYEDDGDSFDYEKDICAKTEISSMEKDGEITIKIDKRQGTYEGMPEKRSYDIEVYCPKPQSVSMDGWEYDSGRGAVLINADESEDGITIKIR